jgi:hypothetical protein
MVLHSERERFFVVFHARVEIADPFQERLDDALDILLDLYVYIAYVYVYVYMYVTRQKHCKSRCQDSAHPY